VSAYQFYPGGDVEPCAFHLHRGGGHSGQYPWSGGVKRKDRVGDLINLHDVYRALLKSRVRRGAVDFETVETQIVCDEAGTSKKSFPEPATMPTS
jgi:ribonuclease R